MTTKTIEEKMPSTQTLRGLDRLIFMPETRDKRG
jgi:hypothetical protein